MLAALVLRPRSAALLCLGCLPMIASLARADVVMPTRWDHMTVETWDGWLYHDVTVEAAENEGYLRVVRGDASQRVFAYAEVRTIWTESGTDVTEQFIPDDAVLFEPQEPPRWGRRVPDDAPPPQIDPEVPRFRAAVSAGVGWGLPMGDWFTGLEDGVSYAFQVRAAVQRYVYLTAVLRNQSMDVSGYMPNYPGGYQVFSGTGHLHQFAMGVGFMPGRATYRQPVPYLELMLAAASHGLDYDARGDVGDYVEQLNDDQFAFVGQFGALVPLNANLALDLQAHWVYTGATEWAHGSVLGAQVGVTFMFTE